MQAINDRSQMWAKKCNHAIICEDFKVICYSNMTLPVFRMPACQCLLINVKSMRYLQHKWSLELLVMPRRPFQLPVPLSFPTEPPLRTSLLLSTEGASSAQPQSFRQDECPQPTPSPRARNKDRQVNIMVTCLFLIPQSSCICKSQMALGFWASCQGGSLGPNCGYIVLTSLHVEHSAITMPEPQEKSRSASIKKLLKILAKQRAWYIILRGTE